MGPIKKTGKKTYFRILGLFSTLSEPFTKPFALKLILFEFILVPRFFV